MRKQSKAVRLIPLNQPADVLGGEPWADLSPFHQRLARQICDALGWHDLLNGRDISRTEERRVGKECRYWRDWSSDVCSSDLADGSDQIGHLRRSSCGSNRRQFASSPSINRQMCLAENHGRTYPLFTNGSPGRSVMHSGGMTSSTAGTSAERKSVV